MEVLRVAFYPDIPQAFRFVNLQGETKLVGPYAEALKNFAKYNNYDLQVDILPSYKVSVVQRNIEQGSYNMSMRAVAYKNAFANISFSYPMEWAKVCVMVPTLPEMPRYWYILLPFDNSIWLCLCLMVLYVAFLMRVLNHPSNNFARNLLTSLAVVLNSSNMQLRVINTTVRLQFFYILLLLVGFILSSIYGSFLCVYNMKPILQPYPQTAEDLLRSRKQIWIPSQLLEEMRNNPHVDLSHIEPIIYDKPQSEVTREIQDLSRKHAYTVTITDWGLTDKLQKNLIQPIYKLSNICPIKSYFSYPISFNAKFASNLDHFILLIQQAGLWEFWEDQAFASALQAKVFSILLDSYPVDPLNLNYFRIAWIIFAIGNILSLICILAERAVYNYQNKTEVKKKSSLSRFIESILVL